MAHSVEKGKQQTVNSEWVKDVHRLPLTIHGSPFYILTPDFREDSEPSPIFVIKYVIEN